MQYTIDENLLNILYHKSSESMVIAIIIAEQSQHTRFPINFLKLDGENFDSISYLNNRDIDRTNQYNRWESSRRTSSKIGRVLRQAIPEAFLPYIHDSEIEKAVNIIKAELVVHIGEFYLESSDMIAHWYQDDKVCRTVPIGSLSSSCMRYPQMKDGLHEFYSGLGDQVQILSFRNSNDQVLGRALVWTTKKGEVLLDRVYASDANIKAFQSYARKQGWHARQQNSYEYPRQWIDPNGDAYTKTFKFNLPSALPKFFPYLDSFKFFDVKTLTMHNSETTTHHVQAIRTDGSLGIQYEPQIRNGRYEDHNEWMARNWGHDAKVDVLQEEIPFLPPQPMDWMDDYTEDDTNEEQLQANQNITDRAAVARVRNILTNPNTTTATTTFSLDYLDYVNRINSAIVRNNAHPTLTNRTFDAPTHPVRRSPEMAEQRAILSQTINSLMNTPEEQDNTND